MYYLILAGDGGSFLLYLLISLVSVCALYLFFTKVISTGINHNKNIRLQTRVQLSELVKSGYSVEEAKAFLNDSDEVFWEKMSTIEFENAHKEKANNYMSQQVKKLSLEEN